MAKAYGKALRPLWHLAPEGAFLNHGSYGACPRVVLAEQERLRLAMETHPDRFFREDVMPREGMTALREAASRLAAFVGCNEERIAFIENATAGVQALVRSVPLERGDEVLINDHTYNAVRLIVEARCAETGAVSRVIALPTGADADEIVACFRDATTPRLRLAIVDHITSPTALAMPIERIVRELKRSGARVIVDGAHGVGHVPLDLPAMGVDGYVSNAHKWLFAPKGTAFMYASPEAAAIAAPPVISHFVGLGFPRSFDYVATHDYTAWLALPAALDFFESLDPPAADAYRAHLIDHATERFADIGVRPVASEELRCSMRSFLLPQRRKAEGADVPPLVRGLWERHRIQAMAVVFRDELLLRVSAQVYVDESDIDALATALKHDGWPGL